MTLPMCSGKRQRILYILRHIYSALYSLEDENSSECRQLIIIQILTFLLAFLKACLSFQASAHMTNLFGIYHERFTQNIS